MTTPTPDDVVQELRDLYKWCSPQYGDPMKKADAAIVALRADLAAAREARDIAVADAIFAKAAMESGDKLLKEAQEALDQCRTLYNETIQRAVRAETLAEQNAKDAKEAIAIAGLLFDAWEEGTPCFETDGESGMGASIGNAFKLSDEDFTRCTNFLNRVDPRGTAIDAARSKP